MRMISLGVIVAALQTVAIADEATVVETHGIEIEVPKGWTFTNRGQIGELVPTKYKGRAIEIASVKTMPAPTKEAITALLAPEKLDIVRVGQLDRYGLKIVTVIGKVATKDKGVLDVDIVVLPVGTSATMLMSFIRSDQDPMLREANDKLLLSARVAGQKLSIVVTKPKNTALMAIPDGFENGMKVITTGFDGVFRFPRALPVKFEECGVINAFYSPTDHSIRLCHEFFDDTYKLFKKSGMADDKAMKLTRGTLGFAFFHEFGHALVGELGLPITGKGEDAADEIATILLSQAGEAGSEVALSGAAWFQTMSAQPGHKSPFWDEHSFNDQRVVSITCLLYGSNPTKYAPVMKMLKIPDQRLVRCQRDFADRLKAWNLLLEPHMRKATKK
ncbi:MAG TPA: DUF4344 domain-containing metallopeptidase [Kofleriaceae bacterium]|nr:DUF4344 domain-containing metallopeptidase [Kofleriaceae bacterium]